MAELIELPNEILQKIFLLLPEFHVQNSLALVCKRFLKITRDPIFVQTLEVDLVRAFNSPNSIYKSDEYVKIQRCLKIYPECKLIIQYTERLEDYDNVRDQIYKNQDIYYFMRSLIHLGPMIKELKLKFQRQQAFEELCAELARKEISFKNLNSISITFLGINWGIEHALNC